MFRSCLFLLASSPLLSPVAIGQSGDVPGEEQPPLPADLALPPAPIRSPSEELATFSLPRGLRVELVAAEPLVHDPVAIAFDEDGAMWVVEMRGFMPDVDGHGELDPVGSIAVLRDLDGDGAMDERRVFLDRLVLPRAVAPTRGGALVICPPQLLFARDADGDGLADEIEVVDQVGRTGLDNPEHAINGLAFALEGGFRCANAARFYRFTEEGWSIERTAGGGQWGICRDDLGRFFFNTNSDPLRGDLYDSAYAIRNPNAGRAWGVNRRVASDFEVYPGRINPGVNRGYKPGTLREDYSLRVFTAACSPLILRGDAIPDWLGDAIVAEPSGNLLKHYRLHSQEDGSLVAENAWPGRELWTSRDERFRPVDLKEGPDGALYVVDLYRGILQHRVFMTTFLRRQVLERGLQRGIGLGRIWRLVPEGFQRPEAVRLGDASWTELSRALSHPNGWTRDTAQRLIVEEGRADRDAIDLCRQAARGSESALGRLQALWALAGIDALDRPDVLLALADPDARVVEQAVRLAEPWLASGEEELAGQLGALARRGPLRVRRQVLLSLGQAEARASDAVLAELVLEDASSAPERSLVLSGLHQRELEFLERLFKHPAWDSPAPGRSEMVSDLARCVAVEGRSHTLERLITLAAERARRTAPYVDSIAQGILTGRGTDALGQPAVIRLTRAPSSLTALLDSAMGEVRTAIEALADALIWPGRPGAPQEVEVRPLNKQEQRRFELGREAFVTTCAACHQLSGRGEAGTAPALRASPIVLGPPERLLSVLLYGLQHEPGSEGLWMQEMPAFQADDETLAALATYLRREWGHGAEPVEPQLVEGMRAALESRKGPWTRAELGRHYGE